MGKKRTHAETKDGFAKPSPAKSRLSAKPDKKDQRKNGETKHPKSALVRVACARTDDLCC